MWKDFSSKIQASTNITRHFEILQLKTLGVGERWMGKKPFYVSSPWGNACKNHYVLSSMTHFLLFFAAHLKIEKLKNLTWSVCHAHKFRCQLFCYYHGHLRVTFAITEQFDLNTMNMFFNKWPSLIIILKVIKLLMKQNLAPTTMTHWKSFNSLTIFCSVHCSPKNGTKCTIG